MEELNKKSISESDICDQFITPAVVRAGWNFTLQVRREVTFTDGRIIVRGQMAARNQKRKRADYVLSHKPGIRLAVNHGIIWGGSLVPTNSTNLRNLRERASSGKNTP